MITDKELKELEARYATFDTSHRHSGAEVIQSGAANACPICQGIEITALKAKIDAAKGHLERGLNGYTGFSITRQQTNYLATHAGNALKELTQ